MIVLKMSSIYIFLLLQLAELWPQGYMDNVGIKDAISRSKDRKRLLYNQQKVIAINVPFPILLFWFVHIELKVEADTTLELYIDGDLYSIIPLLTVFLLN